MDRLTALWSHLDPRAAGGAAASGAAGAAAGGVAGAGHTLRFLAPRAVRPADIIVGCGPITKKYGGPEQVVVDGAVDAALQAGVVDFDTVPLYGDSSPAS